MSDKLKLFLFFSFKRIREFIQLDVQFYFKRDTSICFYISVDRVVIFEKKKGDTGDGW